MGTCWLQTTAEASKPSVEDDLREDLDPEAVSEVIVGPTVASSVSNVSMVERSHRVDR